MEAGNVKKLIDRGVFTAAAAQEAGLVDQVVQASRTKEKLKKIVDGGDSLKVVGSYKRKRAKRSPGLWTS